MAMVEVQGIEFEARVEMISGRRGYGKRVPVTNIQVKLWVSPDGEKRRAYINGEVTQGTSSQRGRYPLGWFGPSGTAYGQQRGEEFNWGDATEEQRQAIAEAAREVLA